MHVVLLGHDGVGLVGGFGLDGIGSLLHLALCGCSRPASASRSTSRSTSSSDSDSSPHCVGEGGDQDGTSPDEYDIQARLGTASDG